MPRSQCGIGTTPRADCVTLTVELVVDERPGFPGGRVGVLVDSMEPPERVFVEVIFHEGQLRARVRNAGGRWDPKRRAWELPFDTVKRMGLEGRIQFKAM